MSSESLPFWGEQIKIAGAGSISIKVNIVTNNDREITGGRNLVNFGHSIGHAIQAVFMPTIPHGECACIRMVPEAELASQLSITGQGTVGCLVHSRGVQSSLSPIHVYLRCWLRGCPETFT